MNRRTCYSAELKAEVALAAVSGSRTLAELASEDQLVQLVQRRQETYIDPARC